MKSWEVVLIIIIMFLICSTSLYWYGYFNKTQTRNVQNEVKAKQDEFRMKWEKDTAKWQKDATDNINGLRQSQQQVLDVINFNVSIGRLIVPYQEKKK